MDVGTVSPTARPADPTLHGRVVGAGSVEAGRDRELEGSTDDSKFEVRSSKLIVHAEWARPGMTSIEYMQTK